MKVQFKLGSLLSQHWFILCVAENVLLKRQAISAIKRFDSNYFPLWIASSFYWCVPLWEKHLLGCKFFYFVTLCATYETSDYEMMAFDKPVVLHLFNWSDALSVLCGNIFDWHLLHFYLPVLKMRPAHTCVGLKCIFLRVIKMIRTNTSEKHAKIKTWCQMFL